MGLDMNIYKNKTVGNNLRTRESGEKWKRTVEITDVLYLRKANQIHRYIVQELGGGIDECQEICMDIDDIKTLNNICKYIVKKSKLGEGWVSYSYMSGKRLDKHAEVELAKKDGLKFVPAGKVSADKIKVGDYLYDTDTYAEKVEGIENNEEDDTLYFRCGAEQVAKVITNPELAEKMLPTQSGFFFGDTNYTEYYLDDLKEYIRQADEIIADYEEEIKAGVSPFDIDYTYQASW